MVYNVGKKSNNFSSREKCACVYVFFLINLAIIFGTISLCLSTSL